MWSVLAGALLAAGPGWLEVTEAVERVPLGGAEVTRVEVQPLSAEVVLFSPSARTLSRRLAARPSRLCPSATADGQRVRLRCATRRVLAQVKDGVLELRQLRGIPYQSGDSTLPLMAWDPMTPGACAQVEEAVARSDMQAAQEALSHPAQGVDADYVMLRQGDLFLAQGDLERALEKFRATSHSGPWLRMARARLCEIQPQCDPSGGAFQDAGLAVSLRDELRLRRLRVVAFRGGIEAATDGVEAWLRADGTWPCDTAPLFCAQLAHLSLTSRDLGAQRAGLALFVALSEQRPQPLELIRDAAKGAQALGAPAFGAELLSEVTAQVPEGELEEHLLLIARLYAAARDEARLAAILDFAGQKLGPQRLRRRAWRTLGVRDVAPKAARPVQKDHGDGWDVERAQSTVLRARLRTRLESAE